MKILELADRINNIEKEKRKILRKLDRSRRATNRNNFNLDRTIKKQGNKKVWWIRSNRYIKLQQNLKELYRKQKDIRKYQHEKLANEIISLGDNIYVEKMNFSGLQKRSKKTELNEKGKFKRKKRFEKSLGNKAPSMFLEILERKLLKFQKTLKKNRYNEIGDLDKEIVAVDEEIKSSYINIIGGVMVLERRDNLYDDIKALLESARKKVLSIVNSTITLTYFLIGKKIVKEEQNGELRAEYGKELIKNLATQLTKEFGKGFTVRNLELIRKFYMTFSENLFKLSWTHYIRLVRIQNVEERRFYEIEAEKENWTVRERERQISSCLYERLVLSRDKEEIKALSTKGQIIEKSKDIIKDPYILEFLGLHEMSNYSENTLETSIINHIEKFIMELGKGFLFQGRQVRFSFDEEHFFFL